MPAPLPQHIEELGPEEILPFQRNGQFNKELPYAEKEVFPHLIYDATDSNGKFPPNVILVNSGDILVDPKKGRYLWVIDKKGLRIILEAEKNEHSIRGCMCHTNITGGEPALQGGELWFGANGKIYINYKSGRYGSDNPDHWIAVVNYFKFVGYKEIEVVR